MTHTVQITDIEFDFDDYDDAYPDEINDDYKQQITEKYIGMIVELDLFDGDDEEVLDELLDEVSDSSGWCIKHIDFRHVLK